MFAQFAGPLSVTASPEDRPARFPIAVLPADIAGAPDAEHASQFSADLHKAWTRNLSLRPQVQLRDASAAHGPHIPGTDRPALLFSQYWRDPDDRAILTFMLVGAESPILLTGHLRGRATEQQEVVARLINRLTAPAVCASIASALAPRKRRFSTPRDHSPPEALSEIRRVKPGPLQLPNEDPTTPSVASTAIRISRRDSTIHPHQLGATTPVRGPTRGGALQAFETLYRDSLHKHYRRILRDEARGLLPPSPNHSVVGVPDFRVANETESWLAISRGLAFFLAKDLALLRQLVVLDRIHLGAFFDVQEDLSPRAPLPPSAARTREATVGWDIAPRISRLLGASHLIQGHIQETRTGLVRLHILLFHETTVDTVTTPYDSVRNIRRLLKSSLPKVVGALGIPGLTADDAMQLSVLPSEEYAAFLAFAEGLLAEERGDLRKAAAAYAQAAARDARFSDARERQAIVSASNSALLRLAFELARLESTSEAARDRQYRSGVELGLRPLGPRLDLMHRPGAPASTTILSISGNLP